MPRSKRLGPASFRDNRPLLARVIRWARREVDRGKAPAQVVREMTTRDVSPRDALYAMQHGLGCPAWGLLRKASSP